MFNLFPLIAQRYGESQRIICDKCYLSIEKQHVIIYIIIRNIYTIKNMFHFDYWIKIDTACKEEI
jgi:hypothetical protein